ncbi:MAG: hypothetical protein Q9O24_11625 [Gammaproteobacteria bacterium]|nr:hypothetical protein [Gammaproteobacteria bacterium]
MTENGAKKLLSIVELGGYANCVALYKQVGFEVTELFSMRKAFAYLKKNRPAVVIAEFNFQSDFRDRTSSLESLMAVLQRMPETKIVVFYDREQAHQLEKLSSRFPLLATLTYPLDTAQLQNTLQEIINQ